MYESTADRRPERRGALDFDELPGVFAWLWVEFCAMPRSGGFDRARLTSQDIESWQRLKDFRFSQYEIDLLIELDGVEPKNALGEGND